jgi:hypothetical protein
MRKLQIEDAEVMRIAIQQEIGRSEESRYDRGLQLFETPGQSSGDRPRSMAASPRLTPTYARAPLT